MDVGVAGRAQRGRVGFAEESRRSSLAGFADPDPLVPGSHPVGGVDSGVAAGAEVRRIGAAVHRARRGAARVAPTCPAVGSSSGDVVVAGVALFLQHFFFFLTLSEQSLSLGSFFECGNVEGGSYCSSVRERSGGERIQVVTHAE